MGKKVRRLICIDGEIAYIPLTKGYFAIIDYADIDKCSDYSWRAQVNNNNKRVDVYTTVNRKTVSLTKILMDTPKGYEVDHIDRNPLNNKRSNLRICTREANVQNKGIYKNNSSGFVGVYWKESLKKWCASLAMNGKLVHLGVFETPEEANRIREISAAEYRKKFNLG